MRTEQIYIGPYKVVKFYQSGRREILRRGLTREEAQSVVRSYPDRSKTLVGFAKQYSSNKYFKTI